MLTVQQLKQFRDRLHALRGRLDERAPSLREEACHSAGGEVSGDLSHAPIHLADVGNQEAESVVSVALAENEVAMRQEVDAALERLDAGTFGICERCQRSIDPERLRAIPYARWCVLCAETKQRTK